LTELVELSTFQADFRTTLDRDKHNNLRYHVGNVLLMLQYAIEWRGIFAYDAFRQEVILKHPVPRHDGYVEESFEEHPITDTDVTVAHVWFTLDDYPKVPRGNIENAIPVVAAENSFHPILDYFNSLNWDGEKRLDDWLITHGGARYQNEAEQKYVQGISAMSLLAAVARIKQPGCKADHVLIIEGKQGIGKSTALLVLAGEEWFSDNLPHDLTAKDAKDHLRGAWIIELPELAGIKKHEVEETKAFISRREEKFRPSYGRFEITYKRQCVFFGTTNSSTYLRDDSGNRRFWPVHCDPDGGMFDLDGLARNRDQIWAEALVRYDAGEAWHFTDIEMIEEATRQQGDRFAEDVWESKVLAYAAGNEKFTTGDILREALDVKTPSQDRAGQNRVGGILRSHGYTEGKKSNRGRTWKRIVTE